MARFKRVSWLARVFLFASSAVALADQNMAFGEEYMNFEELHAPRDHVQTMATAPDTECDSVAVQMRRLGYPEMRSLDEILEYGADWRKRLGQIREESNFAFRLRTASSLAYMKSIDDVLRANCTLDDLRNGRTVEQVADEIRSAPISEGTRAELLALAKEYRYLIDRVAVACSIRDSKGVVSRRVFEKALPDMIFKQLNASVQNRILNLGMKRQQQDFFLSQRLYEEEKCRDNADKQKYAAHLYRLNQSRLFAVEADLKRKSLKPKDVARLNNEAKSYRETLNSLERIAWPNGENSESKAVK